MHFNLQVNSYYCKNLVGTFYHSSNDFCKIQKASMGLFYRQYIMQIWVQMHAKPECKYFQSYLLLNFKLFNKFYESLKAFSAFLRSPICMYRSPINLQICERTRSSGFSMSRIVEMACQNQEIAPDRLPTLVLLIAFCLRTFTIKFNYSSFSVPHSQSNDSRALLDCVGVILLSMTKLNNVSLFSFVKQSPKDLRTGCFSNCSLS